MRYFGCIFELSSESISRPYYQWGLSATDAIKKVYGTNSISPLIFSYVDEIEKTIDQHGGTTPCENKLNLLYVNYIKSATNSEEKQLIS